MKPFITFSFVLALASLTGLVADSQTPAPPSGAAVTWGKPVDGLEVGISCDSSVTNSGEFPKLFFYVVNVGDKDIPDVIQSGSLCIVTVNGRHYAQNFYEGKSSYMPPGRKYGPLLIRADILRLIPELQAWPIVSQIAPRPELQKGTNTVSVRYMLGEKKLVASGEIQIIAK